MKAKIKVEKIIIIEKKLYFALDKERGFKI